MSSGTRGASEATTRSGRANGTPRAARQEEEQGVVPASSSAATVGRKRNGSNHTGAAAAAAASSSTNGTNKRARRRYGGHDTEAEEGFSSYSENVLSDTFLRFLPRKPEDIPTKIKTAIRRFDESEHDRIFYKVLRLFMLQGMCGNRVIKREDLRNILPTTTLILPTLQRTNWYLRNKFGMEIVPLVGTLTSETAARETELKNRFLESYQVVIANREDDNFPPPPTAEERGEIAKELPASESSRMALASTVLAIILLQHQQCATSETIKEKLIEIDSRFNKKIHPVFGEWEPLVFRRFYEEALLDRGTIDNVFWYYVGALARTEIGVPHLYDFASRIAENKNMDAAKMRNALRIEFFRCSEEQ
eukprot:gb/GECG01003570.1/.p1 GENE.gb/GECG01003570.1/~~gb/GECG01003570.1/.p1  ORF type:complete len:363 (+),score=58.10 gb/GECG01003570.1/:1-1089(+)